jgi:hypothetical protein
MDFIVICVDGAYYTMRKWRDIPLMVELGITCNSIMKIKLIGNQQLVSHSFKRGRGLKTDQYMSLNYFVLVAQLVRASVL